MCTRNSLSLSEFFQCFCHNLHLYLIQESWHLLTLELIKTLIINYKPENDIIAILEKIERNKLQNQQIFGKYLKQ